MEIAAPGEFPVYQRFPGPFATQQGALVGKEGVGPAMGKISRLGLTMAKLSGLCAGVNPRLSPQNAAPSAWNDAALRQSYADKGYRYAQELGGEEQLCRNILAALP